MIRESILKISHLFHILSATFYGQNQVNGRGTQNIIATKIIAIFSKIINKNKAIKWYDGLKEISL